MYAPRPVADRSAERLGNSNQTIVLYRNLLQVNMLKVQRGEDRASSAASRTTASRSPSKTTKAPLLSGASGRLAAAERDVGELAHRASHDASPHRAAPGSLWPG